MRIDNLFFMDFAISLNPKQALINGSWKFTTYVFSTIEVKQDRR